ncbi:MAG: hypothetical protein ACRD1Q_04745 [Vicinamibacterales bacterium]
MIARASWIAATLLLAHSTALAQVVSHRGFIQARSVLYPQEAINDDRQVLVEGLFRYEPTLRVAPWLRAFGGIDLRTDSWDQTDGEWQPDFRDRGILRPTVSIRRLSANINRGGLNLDLGKQFIRWGKTDILVPTDRFAPRDFIEVTNDEFLAVTGARLVYEASRHTFDLIWIPWFTPSRVPLPAGRWFPVPEVPDLPSVTSGAADFPSGSQLGARWSVVTDRYEFSLSIYDGFNHLPTVDPEFRVDPVHVELVRVYPDMRMYGGDGVIPLRWFTVKGEAGYFENPDQRTDEYVLYVVQVERQTGEWVLVGGYAGEAITERRTSLSFAPDRGLTHAFVGRAAYTIDPNRSLAFDGAQRDNGDGTWVRVEYSQAWRAHWRGTVSGTLIRGKNTDFLGQYDRNSHMTLGLRYSF